jgi:hypothetical protein
MVGTTNAAFTGSAAASPRAKAVLVVPLNKMKSSIRLITFNLSDCPLGPSIFCLPLDKDESLVLMVEYDG